MRWFQTIGAALLLSWPSDLAAREIVVKSGEHPARTRLVIYTDRSETPKLVHLDGGYRFSVGTRSNEFDLSTVFQKIPRTRISNLVVSATGELQIDVQCNCHVETERLTTGQFVIDVIDGSMPDQMLGAQNEKDAAISHKAELLPVAMARGGLPLAGFSIVGDRAEESTPIDVKDPVAGDIENSPLRTHPLREELLLRQLARAASQGLLSASSAIDLPDPDLQEKENGIVSRPTDKAEQENTADHLNIQTIVDRDVGDHASVKVFSDDGTKCLPDASLSISDWGQEGAPSFDFSVGRADLLGEFDVVKQASFERMVKQQLYLTLGAETQSQIQNDKGDLPDRKLLLMMAEIMDTGAARDFHWMTSQLTCDGPAVLWAVLAHPRLPRDPQTNSAALIAAFSALPRHLRKHLGPMVMRKVLAIGDTETAIEVNKITERGANVAGSAMALSSARLSLATGDTGAAITALNDVVAGDDQNSVEAILHLVETKISTRQGIPDRTLELLASLAHEHRTTTTGKQLSYAEIKALIHMARFEDVMPRISLLNNFPAAGEGIHAEILQMLGTSLVNNASDSAFLRYTLGYRHWGELDQSTRVLIAQRLLDLGFATDAKTYLVQAKAPPNRAARLLIAKASLRSGEAQVALGYLAGLDGAEANQLRDRALEKTGRDNSSNAVPNQDRPIPTTTPTGSETLATYRALVEESKVVRDGIVTSLDAAPAN